LIRGKMGDIMQKDAIKNEHGSIEVEATVILPLVILCVFLLLLISELIFQRALLQSSLENALTYYSTIFTDDYVSITDTAHYYVENSSDGSSADRTGRGNYYTYPVEPLFPYRGFAKIFKSVNEADFKSFFLSTGTFLSKKNMDVKCTYENKIVYEELKGSVIQKVQLPIDFSFLGIPKEVELDAYARVVIVDNDNLIDYTDLAIHWINKTKLGDMIKSMGKTVEETYNKIRGFLGAK